MASDRAAHYERKPEVVEDEISSRVRELVRKDRADFSGVHAIPAGSGDVPDETTCRLVILGTNAPHRPRSDESKAIDAAKEILERRGNSPRLYRNMLVFLAPDADRLAELQQAVRSWLAWTSIQQDEEQLNLDAAQKRQVSRQIQNHEETISSRILETYCHLLVPTQEGTNPIEWQASRLQGDQFVGRVSRKLKNDQQFITDWSPALLRMELDRWLWKDANHLSVKQLWEYMAQYLYLSRLKDENVLVSAIRNGVGSLTWGDYFAYASAIKEDGSYMGLLAGSLPSVTLDGVSVVVKPEAARKQRDKEAEVDTTPSGYHTGSGNGGEQGGESGSSRSQEGTGGGTIQSPPKEKIYHRFHATVQLDPTRVGSSAGRIAEEVLAHLSGLVGSKVTVTMEIDVEVPAGIPEDKIRIVTENSNTLRFKSHEFDEL
jgi:hypothetical protein